MRFLPIVGAAATALALLSGAASAQNYPNRTIEVVTHAGNPPILSRWVLMVAGDAIKPAAGKFAISV